MSVYVGPSQYPYGRMIMCHMVADTLPELHAMADRIGVQRKWFQDTRIPHYDIAKSKRHLARQAGALGTDERIIVKIGLRCREHEWVRRMVDAEDQADGGIAAGAQREGP